MAKEGTPAWSVVVVVFRDGDVLAISRNFNPRDPSLPGGDSDPTDEDPGHTAARELFEETGIRAVELRAVDQWTGDRGQPVFAFIVPKWRGKRLRTSDEGKPFWTHPKSLLIPTATYRESAQRLFEKLTRGGPAVLTGT